MDLVINRILFSIYCLKNGIATIFDNYVFKHLFICLCKFLYKYDPFGNIRKDYTSFDEYVNNTFDSAKEAAENEDYGLSIINSQGTLCVVIFPFILSVMLMLSYFTINLEPMILVVVSITLSYITCYLCSFKDNKYKAYFADFRKSKYNEKWHIATACIFCLAIITFIISFIMIVSCNYK